MRFLLRLPAVAFAALLLVGAAGCGFFSSDEEALPGVYEVDEFRFQNSQGQTFDVGDDGVTFTLTLTEDGQVTEGQLTVPSDAEGVAGRIEVFFSGTYERDGERVAFSFDGEALAEDYFDTGTPLAELEWVFFEKDGVLRADAEPYVLFLEKVRKVDENG